jgi:nicotinamidase-related amidase
MTGSALVLIDVFSKYQFANSVRLMAKVEAVLPTWVRIRKWAEQHGLPIIYANDHLNDWRADFKRVVETSAHTTELGAKTKSLLLPSATDYLIVKHRHSAFYETYLASLLEELRVYRLILVGATTEQCILFTAMDAHLRKFELWIPRNAVASIENEIQVFVYRYFEKMLHADTTEFKLLA